MERSVSPPNITSLSSSEGTTSEREAPVLEQNNLTEEKSMIYNSLMGSEVKKQTVEIPSCGIECPICLENFRSLHPTPDKLNDKISTTTTSTTTTSSSDDSTVQDVSTFFSSDSCNRPNSKISTGKRIILCPHSKNNKENVYTHGMCLRCFKRIVHAQQNNEDMPLNPSVKDNFFTFRCPICRKEIVVDMMMPPFNNFDCESEEDEDDQLLQGNCERKLDEILVYVSSSTIICKFIRILKSICKIWKRKIRIVFKFLHIHRKYTYVLLGIYVTVLNVLPHFITGLYAGYPCSLLDELIRSSVSATWFIPLTTTCWLLCYYFGKNIAKTIIFICKLLLRYLILPIVQANTATSSILTSTSLSGLVQVMRNSLKNMLGIFYGGLGAAILPTILINRFCVRPREDKMQQLSLDLICGLCQVLTDLSTKYVEKRLFFTSKERQTLNLFASIMTFIGRVLSPTLGCCILRDQCFSNGPSKLLANIRLM